MHSSTKAFSTTDDWSIAGLTVVDKRHWLVYMVGLAYFYFSQWFQHFLTSLPIFWNSEIVIVLIPLYSFPSLNWVIKLSLNWATVPYMNFAKQCILNMILLDNRTQYDFASVISLSIVTYDTHSFFITLPPPSYFFHCKWLTFEADEKKFL